MTQVKTGLAALVCACLASACTRKQFVLQPGVAIAIAAQVESGTRNDSGEHPLPRLLHPETPQTLGKEGTLFLPYLGHVTVTGRTVAEAQALLESKLRTVTGVSVRIHLTPTSSSDPQSPSTPASGK